MAVLQAWYDTGNVTIANGSANLVGSGTLWNAFIRVGDIFSAQGLTVRVLTVVDNTHITLANNWSGTSISGGTYEIRTPPPSADITPDLRALVLGLTSPIITEIGSISFTEGDLLGYFGGVLATTPSASFATLTGSQALTNKTINASSNTITNLTTSMFASNVIDTDITLAANSDTRLPSQKAVKSYFDNFITGLQWKTACLVATTVNITLSGEQTIDGTLTSSSRVLVKNQSTASQNGLYVSGSGSWTRTTDADSGAELPSATVFIEKGTVNADTQWTCTNDSVTLGSTSVSFAQVSGSGTYSAGTGLTLTGNQFSIAANAITYALFQQVAASSLVGNATGSLANATGITIGATLAFSGSALQTVAHTGDVTTSANSFATTVAKIQSTVVSGTTGSVNVVFSTSPSITSPTISTPTVTGGTHTAITGLGVRSTGAAFDVKIAASEVLTADRTLTLILNDINRTISLTGNITTAGAFTTSGANPLTLTTTGSTTVTLPTTGTLSTLAGAETLTNKVINASNNTVSNIDTTMFATNVVDTDVTLTANSATRFATQSAVKGYVDALVQGLAWKRPVACVATSNITLSGEQTIDGVLTSTSRVLVMSQSTGSQNGIYVSAAGAWTRATDADTGIELVWATTVVEAGTVSAGVVYTCNNTSITLGVTTPNFVIAGVSTSTISAGTGLTTSGSIMSVQTNGITYALFQQVAASSLVGNATGSLANATGITLGATLAFSGSALQTAALTGDVTSSANSFATTVAKIQSTVVSGTTGSGNVVFSASPTITGTATFSGAISSTLNGALSAPAVTISGTPIQAGGTATTTKPLFLIETTGAASTGWATVGTMLGINAPSGVSASMALLDLQTNGVDKHFFGANGDYVLAGSLTQQGASSVFGGNAGQINSTNGVVLANNKAYSVSSTSGSNGTPDVFMSRNATGVWQMGTSINNALGSLLVANITVSGTTTIVTQTAKDNSTKAASTAYVDSAILNPNKIINGGMDLDQRNAGLSTTPTSSGTYTLDRWYANLSVASKYSVQQDGGSLTAPAGCPNWLCAVSLSSYSVGASEAFSIAQAIEGLNTADLQWGTANAKTVTLSFLVQSTLTGTFGGAIQNSGHARSYPFSYSIPVANTWTQVTVTIPGDTSGTWLPTTGIGIGVYFSLGSGTTMSGTAATWASANYFAPTGAVSVVGTNGAKLAITAVKLEAGSVATPYVADDYATLLQKCYRYFRRMIADFLAGANGTGSLGGSLYTGPMRVIPTFTVLTYPTTYAFTGANVTMDGIQSTFLTAAGNQGINLSNSVGTVSGMYQLHDGEYKFDAEI